MNDNEKHCGWCFKNASGSHKESCPRPKIIETGSLGREFYLQLRLNGYQAVNLMWLLDMVMGTQPFDVAHSGDWVGEIYSMLAHHKDFIEDFEPNETIEEAVNSAKYWASVVDVIEK